MRPPFDFEDIYEKPDDNGGKMTEFVTVLIGLCIFFGFLLLAWLRS